MSHDTSDANVKKFIPKRRTPYLMQEEVIRQKELLSEKLNDQNINVLESNLIGSQLAVKKTSISSPAKDGIHEEINFHDEVLLLSGLQKAVAHFFTKKCIERDSTETGIITSVALANAVGTTQKTVKKILERMLEKRLFCRLKGKPGKGGFSIFSLDKNFIKIIRLQLEMESNFIAVNNVVSRSSLKDKGNEFPSDWNSIDLKSLIDAFKNCRSENTQFFGKNQLKIIYSHSGNLISYADVQESINAFAYGLKHFSEKAPYSKMNNPAAVLFETLKNGGKWEEIRYLSEEESSLYAEYTYLSEAIQNNMKKYYNEWKNTDKDKRYKHYQMKMRSNEFYNEKVFNEKAWEDYSMNIWPKEKNKFLIENIGITENLLKKFERISTDK